MESTLYIIGALALGLALYFWRKRIKRLQHLEQLRFDAEFARNPSDVIARRHEIHTGDRR